MARVAAPGVRPDKRKAVVVVGLERSEIVAKRPVAQGDHPVEDLGYSVLASVVTGDLVRAKHAAVGLWLEVVCQTGRG